MSKKPKFKPEVTRIALNPEQAVLLCACYDTSHQINGSVNKGPLDGVTLCQGAGKARAHADEGACTGTRGANVYAGTGNTTTS